LFRKSGKPDLRCSAGWQVGTKGWSLRSNQGMMLVMRAVLRFGAKFQRKRHRLVSSAHGIERGLARKHGTGDGEEAIADGAESTGMTVTAMAQRGVFGSAPWIVLHGDTGPVIEGVGEALMGRLSSLDDLRLARAFSDRGDAAQTPQSVVISAPQGIPSLCEQRGEYDPSDSGKDLRIVKSRCSPFGPVSPASTPASRSVKRSRRASASAICRLTSSSRLATDCTWATAASMVPAATVMAG
jgi:hypothetical protein